MKKIIILALFLSTAAALSAAQPAQGRIQIGDLHTEDAGETLKVGFTARIAPRAVKRNHTLVFVPVIEGGGYRQSLSPVVVHGKGSRIARQRREWVARQVAGYENAAVASNGTAINVSAEVPFQKWMSGASLVFESVEGGCCRYDRLEDALFAENIIVRAEPEPVVVVAEREPEPIPEPVWVPRTVADSLSVAFTFVLPMSEFDPDEPFKIYDDERENALIVYYRLGRLNIDPAYMDNAHTLSNLTSVIDMIMASSDSRVERIVVAGFSSPDGSFEVNDRLAFDRAVSVKKHLIETTPAKDYQIMIHNGSTDWRGLRAMVERSALPEKQQIISIIDNTPVWDAQRQVGRLGELMRLNGGRTYRYLYNEYFPYLRNGAFIKVYYENRQAGAENR